MKTFNKILYHVNSVVDCNEFVYGEWFDETEFNSIVTGKFRIYDDKNNSISVEIHKPLPKWLAWFEFFNKPKFVIVNIHESKLEVPDYVELNCGG